MVILFTFLLGIGNFALNKAILESAHPLVSAIPAILRANGGRLALVGEFGVLLTALLLVANGQPGWSWAYLAYSLSNGVAAWLILSDRV